MEVTIVNNPLKIIQCKGTFKESQNNPTQNSIFVNLIPSYMDVTKGVWNICLDSYALKSNTETPLQCVLEVSTNLVTSYKYNSDNYDTYESSAAIMGHMSGFGTKKTFDYFDKKWFTIDSLMIGPVLKVMLKQNDIFKMPTIDVSYNMTVLFQRIK